MPTFSTIDQGAIDSAFISRSAFGQKVKDNFDAHEGRLVTVESRTTDTVTSPGGIGNQRLADRFGSGVGTGSNVISGSAAAQFADLRTRASALEGAAPSNGSHERESNLALSFGTTETTLLYQTANDTAVGVTYSAGTFTFSKAGRWLVTANSSLSTVSANGIGYAQKIKVNGAARATGISTAPTTGFGSSASTARRVRVAAGDTVTVTVVASAAGQALAGNANTNITLDYIGP